MVFVLLRFVNSLTGRNVLNGGNPETEKLKFNSEL